MVEGVIHLLHLRPGVIVVASDIVELLPELPATLERISHKGVEFAMGDVHARLDGSQYWRSDGAHRF